MSQRPAATVREIADELTQLERSLAAAQGRLETAAHTVAADRRAAQLERVVEALLPASVPSAAAVWHAQRSAEARLALVSEHGAWTAAELAEKAFQFTADGQPRPEIAAVLMHLRSCWLDDWQAARWFVSPTGWLDDGRPVDVLDRVPGAVELAAARFHDRPT